MKDRGRVVVVAAGFALWVAGRCTAAARWSDVRRVRAHRPDAANDDAVRVVVELMDGGVLELHEEAPGLDAFLDRASSMLSGLLPYAAWHPALAAAPAGGDAVVLFERPAPRAPRR